MIKDNSNRNAYESVEFARLATGLDVSSPFYCGQEILDRLPSTLRGHELDRCFLVTSPGLRALYGAEMAAALNRSGARCETILISDSEADKSWGTLSKLCEDLVAAGATKDSVLLACGGGVIGNVVGLAAGLLYRGVRFVEVPTTVQAQTDGALSNKQAINGDAGKNQFGTYHAPLFVWADFAYPRSEPLRQRKAGVVEGIKNVLVSQTDTAAADRMLELAADVDRLGELLPRLIQSKLDIIRKDPTERAYGVVLEYGHTFGHAVEWLSGGTLFHGEAVAIGMCLAARLSQRLGYLCEELAEAHFRLLSQLGAPTALPPEMSTQSIYESILGDNKRTARGVKFVLLSRCGQVVDPDGDYMVAVPRDDVLAVLDEFPRAPVSLEEKSRSRKSSRTRDISIRRFR